MRKNYFLFFLFLRLLLLNPAYGQNPAIAPALEKTRNFVNKKVLDSALVYAQQTLKLADAAHDTLAYIKALGHLGKTMFYQNNYKEAADHYFHALKVCRAGKDDNQVAYLCSEVGYLYFYQGHYNEAKEYYYKALAMRKQLHQDKEVCNALINISCMCRGYKEYTQAFAALNEVGALLPEVKDSTIEAFYYTNRGALLELTQQPDSAAFCYHRAYDIWKKLDNVSEIYKITFNLGYLAEERKDHREALNYYHMAEASALKFGSGHEIAHVYGTMAEAYAELGDYRNAYKNLYKYAELSDSLNKNDFNTYVVKLDKQFQTGKNRETIQEQELKLKSANLALQEQRSTKLLIGIILIAVVFSGIIIFIYFTFQRRLHKRVEEAKGRFFANVVHEIRTPLSMIQGPIKVMLEKTNDPAMHYQLCIAERNTQRLDDLINQMLDISKLDASEYRLKERLGNPGSFIEGVVHQFEVQAGEKNLSFSKQIELLEANFLFDQDAIEKIIGNLLSNAIKYTPMSGAAGVEISMNAAQANELKVVVWDTGPGIPAEEQSKIFDRFYRSPDQQKTGSRGIGIGLALVKELVTLINGTVEVSSEPGKGSVFTVHLPLKQAEPSADIPEPADGTYTILLAEDDKDILDFNKTLLLEKGYNVLTASNGNEASAILASHLPDLVVTDLMMPEKDGIVLLKEIRASEQTNHLPVIILSAKTSDRAVLEGLAGGAQIYLSKPFQPAELVAIIHNQLEIIGKNKALYQEKTNEPSKSIEERFSGNDPFTRKCFLLIQEHLDDAQLSVERLAELMNINRSHFQRKIKTLTGYSPSELIRTIRLEKAREMLMAKEGNITEVAYATGFTSQSYFTKCFSEYFGFPPSQLNVIK